MNRAFYMVEFRSSHCYFEILVNGLPAWSHLRDDGLSTFVPVNHLIPDLGEQALRIRATPRIGMGEVNFIPGAYLRVVIRKYADVSDEIGNYSEVAEVGFTSFDFEAPLPVYESGTVFFADNRFSSKEWIDSVQLDDVETLRSEVETFYRVYWGLLQRRDIEELEGLRLRSEESLAERLYLTASEVEDRRMKFRELISNPNFEMLPFPDSGIVRFFADSRVAGMFLPNGLSVLNGRVYDRQSEEVGSIGFDLLVHRPKDSKTLTIL